MLVSKMYQLVLVKYRLKIIKVEIWVNQYLTNIIDTNWYLTDVTDILQNWFSVSVKHWLISVKHWLIF